MALLSGPFGTATRWEITTLLRRWDEEGDRKALHDALPHLLDELRRLARGYLAREVPDHTLQPTALVHESYLRLLGSRVGQIRNRSQFFAFMARLMRQVLIDHARIRSAAKRGRGRGRTGLECLVDTSGRSEIDAEGVVALHRALERLGRIDPRQRRVAELRYFVGFTVQEIARAMDLSVATVNRSWEAARRWLAREIRDGVAAPA